MILSNLPPVEQIKTYTTIQETYERPANSWSREPALPTTLKSISDAFSDLHRNPAEETAIQNTRRLLGNVAINLSDEQIEVCLAQFDYLINAWLDEFEKSIFADKTLCEFLKNG